MEWVRLPTPAPINLQETLFSGQVFQFKAISNTVFGGILSNRLVFLKQDGSDIYYLNNSPDIANTLCRLFNLDINPDLKLHKPGLRFLTNDFIPTVFSFICSSNNNIKRITKMVDYLYTLGQHVVLTDAEISALKLATSNDLNLNFSTIKFHLFPSLEVLTNSELRLKANKFGYRSRFIEAAAKHLLANPINFLNLSPYETRTALLAIPGIGNKIADCILLISCRYFHVVPIDTHILQYSKKHFGISIKNLTNSAYKMIQRLWADKYGEYAGIEQLHAFRLQIDKI